MDQKTQGFKRWKVWPMFRRTLPKATQEVIEQVCSVFVSKGSLGEVETQLLSAENIGRLSESHYLPIEEKRSENTRLLNRLMKSLT
jgi:four helix bundle protein